MHRWLVYIYLLNVPSFSSSYFNKIKRTSRLGRLLALSLEILVDSREMCAIHFDHGPIDKLREPLDRHGKCAIDLDHLPMNKLRQHVDARGFSAITSNIVS